MISDFLSVHGLIPEHRCAYKAYCLVVGYHSFLSWGHTKPKSDFRDEQRESCQNCQVLVKTKLEFHSCSFSEFQLDLASRNPEK